MSPSATVSRPVWALSLPVAAILLSFLWFRKKRGSLQTDTGGPGETSASAKVGNRVLNKIPTYPVADEVIKVPEVEIPIVNCQDSILLESAVVFHQIADEVNSSPVVNEVEPIVQIQEENITVESVIDQFADEVEQVVHIEEDFTVDVQEATAVNDKLNEGLILEALKEDTVQEVVEDTVPDVVNAELVVEDTVPDVVNAELVVEDAVPEGVKAEVVEENVVPETETENIVLCDASVVNSEPTQKVVDVVEEAVLIKEPIVKSSEVATQLEAGFRVIVPKKADCSDNPSPKWTKKKRGGKNKKRRMSNGGVVDNERRSSGVPLDQQISKLELNNSAGEGAEVKRTGGEGAERDSANNSPSEVMLGSPVLSGYSDTHSEGSSDSGKGCSEGLTPSPTPVSGNSVSGDLPLAYIYKYHFLIPQHLVGRLIGRMGSYIKDIEKVTNAFVKVIRFPTHVTQPPSKVKLCEIEGTQLDIDAALNMIRQKFPKKRYPSVTLELFEVPPEPIPVPVLPANMQLHLVEGVNNDVIMSALVSAGHFFLRQPYHPTNPTLAKDTVNMNKWYSESPDLPTLPDDVEPGVLCVAPTADGWYRAEVISFPEGDYCDVKFVDYGGYMTTLKSNLRQIHADFAMLPFQASECILANVCPASEDGTWSEEAKELVESYTYNRLLLAQIHGYTEHGIPLIYLYAPCSNEVLSINEQLANSGLAHWLLPEPVTEDYGACEEEETTVCETAAAPVPV